MTHVSYHFAGRGVSSNRGSAEKGEGVALCLSLFQWPRKVKYNAQVMWKGSLLISDMPFVTVVSCMNWLPLRTPGVWVSVASRASTMINLDLSSYTHLSVPKGLTAYLEWTLPRIEQRIRPWNVSWSTSLAIGILDNSSSETDPLRAGVRLAHF